MNYVFLRRLAVLVLGLSPCAQVWGAQVRTVPPTVSIETGIKAPSVSVSLPAVPRLDIPALPASAVPLQPAALPRTEPFQSAVLPSVPPNATVSEARAGEGEHSAASKVFDNAYQRRGEVTAALGFDPESLPGELLSHPDKLGGSVMRVRAPPSARGPVRSAVVKVAKRESVTKELFLRNVIKEFPSFSRHFETASAKAYSIGWLGRRSLLVMEGLEARRAPELPTREKAALAVLSYAFGISDLNPDGILNSRGRKPVLIDFEHALTPLRPGMTPGSLSDPMLHLSYFHLNDPKDYAREMRRWKGLLARREIQSRLAEMMRRSGMPPGDIQRNMRILEENARLMERQLAADIESADKSFLEHCRARGLDEAQSLALSRINKAIHAGNAQGAALREAARWLNRNFSGQAKRWNLWPEKGSNLDPDEWLDFAKSRPGFTAAQRALAVEAGLSEETLASLELLAP